MSRTRRKYAPYSPEILKKSHSHIDKRRQEKYKDDLMDLEDKEDEALELYWRELEGEH